MQIFHEQDHKELVARGVTVHRNAVVAAGSEIGTGCIIGPGAVIGPKVKLAKGVQVGAGAVIEGTTSVGADTKIYAHATVGVTPQDLKYRGEDATLEIGERNLIREYVNISIGTEGGGSLTKIGHDNLFMVYTHVAHDCIIGSHCIFANSVQLAGHVTIEDGAVFGGMSGAHQFTRFGTMAMIAAGSVVVQDVLPYCTVQGDRAVIAGLNVVGLRRKGLSQAELTSIKEAFRLVFKENLTVEEAVTRIQSEVEATHYRNEFLRFLQQSKRGICR
jgi:UDP-N-acetylglucosamine acyltransferase